MKAWYESERWIASFELRTCWGSISCRFGQERLQGVVGCSLDSYLKLHGLNCTTLRGFVVYRHGDSMIQAMLSRDKESKLLSRIGKRA